MRVELPSTVSRVVGRALTDSYRTCLNRWGCRRHSRLAGDVDLSTELVRELVSDHDVMIAHRQACVERPRHPTGDSRDALAGSGCFCYTVVDADGPHRARDVREKFGIWLALLNGAIWDYLGRFIDPG